MRGLHLGRGQVVTSLSAGSRAKILSSSGYAVESGEIYGHAIRKTALWFSTGKGADLTLGTSEFIERFLVPRLLMARSVLPPDCSSVSQDFTSLAREENQLMGGIFFWPVS